jgi:hypothetical protein
MRIINEPTAGALATLLIQRLATHLAQIDAVWDTLHVGMRQKRPGKRAKPTEAEIQHAKSMLARDGELVVHVLGLKSTQKLIFCRIDMMLKIMHELATSLLPVKVSQLFIKLLTQLYKIIGHLFKDVCLLLDLFQYY